MFGFILSVYHRAFYFIALTIFMFEHAFCLIPALFTMPAYFWMSQYTSFVTAFCDLARFGRMNISAAIFSSCELTITKIKEATFS